MRYFSNLTGVDRVTFEGQEAKEIFPIIDKKTKEVSHYGLVVTDLRNGATIRKFRSAEIAHLIETEALRIDRGYYSPARQRDRYLHGGPDQNSESKKKRSRNDRIKFLAQRMKHYKNLGMKLTRDGVDEFNAVMRIDYENYQACLYYGTEKPNATQSLKPLPKADTLLCYYRRLRGGIAKTKKTELECPLPTDEELQRAQDLSFILRVLNGYATAKEIAKSEIAECAVKAAEEENARRKAAGYSHLIEVRSVRTYERWIDKYLDPFIVMMKREGIEAARNKFGSVENGITATVPGELVQFDAWKLHVVSLDTTLELWLQMTDEQRKKVKRVRRWVVVAIDVATRCILGFALCRNPDQAASLQALRMCFMDKTFLLRNAGLKHSSWPFHSVLQQILTDSGSEFGKSPFGGSRFVEAARILTASLMNGAVGVPELRPHVERFFGTLDSKWARNLPGWTASNPHARNDRNPHEEACLTDDDLHRHFTTFIAQYHSTRHRGLDFFTPAGTWERLSLAHQFDLDQLPGPTALREACGIYKYATISKVGIQFENAAYSNEFVRDQRVACGAERVAKPGEKVEIMIDPMDLGAISLVSGNGLVTVPALDASMRGKSLDQWRQERALNRRHARADAESRASAMAEAKAAWTGEAEAAAASAGINFDGASPNEINRAAMELRFGKGHHEKPFVGRDEYMDPIKSGFSIDPEEDVRGGDDNDAAGIEPTEVAPDQPNGLNRFRSTVKPRSGPPSRKGDF